MELETKKAILTLDRADRCKKIDKIWPEFRMFRAKTEMGKGEYETARKHLALMRAIIQEGMQNLNALRAVGQKTERSIDVLENASRSLNRSLEFFQLQFVKKQLDLLKPHWSEYFKTRDLSTIEKRVGAWRLVPVMDALIEDMEKHMQENPALTENPKLGKSLAKFKTAMEFLKRKVSGIISETEDEITIKKPRQPLVIEAPQQKPAELNLENLITRFEVPIPGQIQKRNIPPMEFFEVSQEHAQLQRPIDFVIEKDKELRGKHTDLYPQEFDALLQVSKRIEETLQKVDRDPKLDLFLMQVRKTMRKLEELRDRGGGVYQT